jgi:acetyl esterase/lipase
VRFFSAPVFALILLLLSAATYLASFNLWFWRISIITTESGHLFALFCLLWLAFLFLRPALFHKRSVRLVIPVLFFATFLFSLPLFQFTNKVSEWQVQIRKVFAIKAEDEIPANYSRLVFGGLDLNNKYEVLHYVDTEKLQLNMNFYRAQSKAPAPWVVVIPGGGWTAANIQPLWELNAELVSKGYAVAVVSYRVLPEAPWPTPRKDVESAIDYLKTHAKELGLDPNNWAILGRSAGGQIAESIAYAQHPSGLRGGIFFYAPADLHFAYHFVDENDLLSSGQLLRDLLGGPPQNQKLNYDDASPFLAVGPQSVPSLLFHGLNDPLVWTLQSERLFGKLSENGVPVVWIEMPWATHGFDYDFGGPGSVISTYSIENFLKKVFQHEN